MNKFEKSTLPKANPIGGMRTSSTNEAMILPKAAPITTATAKSSTLPRITNSLNSFSMSSSLFAQLSSSSNYRDKKIQQTFLPPDPGVHLYGKPKVNVKSCAPVRASRSLHSCKLDRSKGRQPLLS